MSDTPRAIRPWSTVTYKFADGHELHCICSDPERRNAIVASDPYPDATHRLIGEAFPMPEASTTPDSLPDLLQGLSDALDASVTRAMAHSSDRWEVPADDEDDDTCQCPACRAKRTPPRVH